MNIPTIQYHFAHRILPNFFFHDPAQMLRFLDLGGPEYLRRLYDQLVSASPNLTGGASTAIECDLRVTEGGTRIALVTMPAPDAYAEAYFVALMLPRSALNKHPKTHPDVDSWARYLTLESSMRLDGSARTAFCAWTSDHNHLNFGDGPDPDLDQFYEVIVKTSDL